MSDDLGGNFASDVHRRVLAHLPPPDGKGTDARTLFNRLAPDEHTPVGVDEVADVLADLEADGDATQKGGWKQTKAGYKVLTGPIAEDGGRAHGK